jgi:hypothetical protein
MKKFLIAGSLAAFAVGLGLLESIPTVIQERKKRDEIEIKLQKDLAAIRTAGETMDEMLREGLYSNRSIAELQRDFDGLVKLYQAK